MSPTVRNHRSAPQGRGQRIADAITAFSGSMSFVVLHVIWFGLWIAANLLLPHPFDRFPFGLLTLIVSLEAIFLSTFVLISQNRQSARTDRRALKDFETDLYSEVLLELVGETLGLDADTVQDRYRAKIRESKAEDEQAQ